MKSKMTKKLTVPVWTVPRASTPMIGPRIKPNTRMAGMINLSSFTAAEVRGARAGGKLLLIFFCFFFVSICRFLLVLKRLCQQWLQN